MDKILVTGVAGFIGSNLASYLLENEKNYVIGIDNFSCSTMSNLYPLLKNSRFEFIEHDLKCKLSITPDYVFHFAGNGCFDLYFKDKYNFILNKIEITKNIVELTQSSGAKLFYPIEFIDFQEHNKEYFEYYNCLRLIETLLLQLIDSNNLNCNLIRLCDVYGENMLKNDSRIIPKAINDAFLGNNFNLDYDRSYYFTYIKDVVVNLEKLMNNHIEKSIVEIANKNLYLESDVIKLISSYAKSKAKVSLNSQIQMHPSFSPSDNLKFECKTNVLDGVLNTVKYFKLMYYS